MTNCTFSGNRAQTGGAILTHRNPDGLRGQVTLRNTIFQTGSSGANLATTTGIFVSDGNNLSNDAAGGDGGTGPGGLLNATRRQAEHRSAARFLEVKRRRDRDLRASRDSPAINRETTLSRPPQDQRGFPRFGVSDIGAFEVAAASAKPHAHADADGDSNRHTYAHCHTPRAESVREHLNAVAG